jgi:drug/metabolite transporter (DMT)-like permease
MVLVLFCAWMIYLLFEFPPGLYRFFGICLIAIGVFNVLLHKRFGRQTLKWAHSMPGVVTNFWEYIGKDGVQLFYLGIGIILIAAGLFLWIRSL